MIERDQVDKALSCSFCSEIFSDVVKLIPECGKSICGKCYEHLKEDVDQTSSEYKCPACHGQHILSQTGMSDNSNLSELLSERNTTEKLLQQNAKNLKIKLNEMEAKMKKLQEFDAKEQIECECEKLEEEVSMAFQSAVDHLKEIEESMMTKIGEYRLRCLGNLSVRSLERENSSKQELGTLKREVNEFNSKWNDFFKRIDVYKEELDIEAALPQTAQYIKEIEALEEKLRKEAFNWQTMVFNADSQFLKVWKHVGEIKLIAVTGKRTSIQETPSVTLTGHLKDVCQVLFLPDGRLVSCSDDNRIKVWNVETGEELFQLTGHTDFVHSIASLPNGQLASGSWDSTIKIWDLEERKAIRTIKGHSNSVVSLRLLKNGHLASYSWDDTIKIWNLNSNEDEPISTIKGHGNTYWGIPKFGLLSNDYLVTCSRHHDHQEECIVRVWNPNKANLVKSISSGFTDACSVLVLSNDQVAIGFSSGKIKIIHLANDALSRTRELAHDGYVFSLAQLSNGNLVSAGWDHPNWTIKVWNLLNLSLLQSINIGHSSWIRSLSISGNQRLLASGSDDKKIKLWPIRTE